MAGASGFIGSSVSKSLLKAGADVTGFYYDDGAGAPQSLQYPSVVADLGDVSAVSQFVQKQEIVIHLAGPPSVAASFQDPARYMRVHAEGTANLLEAARQANVRRFIYVSSAEVYGQSQSEYVTECERLQAKSPYAAAKIAAEQLVTVYGQAYELETAILRPFSVYGPGSSPFSVVNRILSAARANDPILLNDLRPVRDYIHVDDVAAAVLKACVLPVPGQAFNVGTMQGTSIAQLAETALRVLGKRLPVHQNSKDLDSRSASADIFRLVADNRKAARELCWRPAMTLEDGLRQFA